MHVHESLVSRSHFDNPKMADPANVWDSPINFFLALGVVTKPTKGTSH